MLISGAANRAYPGLSELEIYPEIEVEDDLGNPHRMPGALYCKLWVGLHPLSAAEWNMVSSSEKQALGLGIATLKQFIVGPIQDLQLRRQGVERIPASAWGKVVEIRPDGVRRDWGIVGEPVISPRMQITRVIIRSRTGPQLHGQGW